jgi:hypothetical protein
MRSIKTDEIGDYTGKHYEGNFNCQLRRLDSLEGAPKSVSGNFYCFSNSNLETLEGGPEYVGGHFNCHSNELESMKGAPVFVGGHFNCINNNNLESLEGLPQYIGGHFQFDEDLKKGENLYIIANALLNGGFFDEIYVLKQLFT